MSGRLHTTLWHKPKIVTGLLALTGLILSVFLYQQIRSKEGAQQAHGVYDGALIRAASLQHELDSAVEVLYSIAALQGASAVIDRTGLNAYTQSVVKRHPAVEAVIWVPAVTRIRSVLDIQLPDGSGLDLLPVIEELEPPVPVLVFSAYDPNPNLVEQVNAALVKSTTSNEELITTILDLIDSGGNEPQAPRILES